MYASPPYRKIESSAGFKKSCEFPLLNNREEYRKIKQSLKKAKIELTLHKVHGTVENLRKVLDQERPGIIHFSGHGVTAEQIKKENEGY
jgi:hypothetical protein